MIPSTPSFETSLGANAAAAQAEPLGPPSCRIGQALDALWRSSIPDVNRGNDLKVLIAACGEAYPTVARGFGFEIALFHALERLGFSKRTRGPAPNAVIEAFLRALAAVGGVRRHCCPLDKADALPVLAFGPNRIVRFSGVELKALIEASLVAVRFADKIDVGRLSQVPWLVVEEPYALASSAGARALPHFHREWSDVLGAVEPHRSFWPPAVEAAAAFLLTAPWEDLVVDNRLDWRGFEIPFVLTLDDDLFAPAPSAPDPDRLSWVPDFVQDARGELVDERLIPEVNRLEEEASGVLEVFGHRAWTGFLMARRSGAMPATVEHFLIRGLVSEGIDEFLFHLTTIEAGLGRSADHVVRGRKALPDGRNAGATARTAWRLSALLDDWTAGEAFEALFSRRSKFVHGEIMGQISADERNQARRLARRCVAALIARVTASTDREAFLQALLDRPRPAGP